MAAQYGFDVNTPVQDLHPRIIDILLYGTGKERIEIAYDREYGAGTYKAPFEGIIPSLERRYKQTQSQGMREYYESLMSQKTCPDCGGLRLRPEARAVTVGGLPITELTAKPVYEVRAFLDGLVLSAKERMIAEQILKELRDRLGFLTDVGLEYLTLSRAAGTLSGGEAQRIRLATQIGSRLMGVLYILDEPSIGLHQRDNARLLTPSGTP